MPHFRRSRECHLIHIHVPRNRRARRRSVPRQHIHHAVRESRLQHQFAHAQSRQRRLLRRLQHRRATRRQRRPQFPSLHQQRKIPRNNLPHHAHRLMLRVREIPPLHRNRLPLNLVRPSRVVPVTRNRQRQIRRQSHLIRFPVVQRLQFRQLLRVLLNQIRQLVHQHAARRSRHLPPRALLKRRPRGRHRLIHVGRIRLRHLRNHFASRRINRRKSLPRSRIHPLPINQKFRSRYLNLGFNHRSRCSHSRSS